MTPNPPPDHRRVKAPGSRNPRWSGPAPRTTRRRPLPAGCERILLIHVLAAQNPEFSGRNSVWLRFTASEDKPHAPTIVFSPSFPVIPRHPRFRGNDGPKTTVGGCGLSSSLRSLRSAVPPARASLRSPSAGRASPRTWTISRAAPAPLLLRWGRRDLPDSWAAWSPPTGHWPAIARPRRDVHPLLHAHARDRRARLVRGLPTRHSRNQTPVANLGARASRPHRTAAVLPSHLRAGHPRPSGRAVPGRPGPRGRPGESPTAHAPLGAEPVRLDFAFPSLPGGSS